MEAQGIPGCRAWSPAGNRRAASPTTSSRRVSARFRRRSESKSFRCLPRTSSKASRAWSRMCARQTRASCCGIDRLGLGQHSIAEVGTQEARSVEVHLPAEDLAELFLNGEKGEPRHVPWLELDQDVDVALGPEVLPQHRTEEGEPADVVLATEGGDGLPVDRDAKSHVRKGAYRAASRPRNRSSRDGIEAAGCGTLLRSAASAARIVVANEAEAFLGGGLAGRRPDRVDERERARPGRAEREEFGARMGERLGT